MTCSLQLRLHCFATQQNQGICGVGTLAILGEPLTSFEMGRTWTCTNMMKTYICGPPWWSKLAKEISHESTEYFLLGQRGMFKNGFPGVQSALHSGLVGVSSYAATTTGSPSPLGLAASPRCWTPRNPAPCKDHVGATMGLCLLMCMKFSLAPTRLYHL